MAQQVALRVKVGLAVVLLVSCALVLVSNQTFNGLASSALGYNLASMQSEKGPTSGRAWEALFTLRDDTNKWSKGKPAGGWFVTAIHGNVLGSGKVLLTGWGRSQDFACSLSGSRRMGVSFLLNPDEITGSSQTNPVYHVKPLDEDPRTPGDVLYCMGHTSLVGGRLLLTGGAYYRNLSRGAELEKEYGLDYARIFDPATEKMSRVEYEMGVGSSWYATNTRLPEGDIVLVYGGFYRCCDGYQNSQIALFNVSKLDLGLNPWQQIVNQAEANRDPDPGMKDYSHIVVLPETVVAGTPPLRRQVAMMGWKGTTVLFNTDPETPFADRYYEPPAGTRRNSGGCGWDSTSALLSTNEIMTMGGCGDNTGPYVSKVDLYDPTRDSWRTFESHIARRTPSSILLPDGTVLLINGENPDLNQTDPSDPGSDPRIAQIFNPETGTFLNLEKEPESPAPFRGYHNMAALLKDGRILTGGGVHVLGGIGCEQPNFRIMNPPYIQRIHNGEARPVFVNFPAEPNIMPIYPTKPTVPHQELPFAAFLFDGPPPRAKGGVVLLALNAFTHGFDHNQRFVSLEHEVVGNMIKVYPPSAPYAIPGEYFMFLVSDSGIPSVGKHTSLRYNVKITN